MNIELFSRFFKSLPDYFENNEYMDKYIKLLESQQDSTTGDKHHAIPVSYYRRVHKCKTRKDAEKLANADVNNIIIRLSMAHHTLAHFYLCKCCSDRLLFERLLNAFKLLFGLSREDTLDLNTLVEKDILEQIELLVEQGRQTGCFGKPVLCVETAEIYPNVSAANVAMGQKRYNYNGIYNACTNKNGQKSALGYHWCFYDDNNIPEELIKYVGSNKQVEYKNINAIYCVETGETFKSAYEASKHFNATRGRILDCCKKSWLNVDGLHFCFESDKNTFEIKAKPPKSEEAKKRISEGTKAAMARIPETKKQEMREKNKKYWAENKLHYYNNGIEEARLPECPVGWVGGRLAKYRTKGKRVKCVELNTVYASAVEAGEKLGINCKGISNCACGKAKTAGGYHWQYA